MWMEGKVVPPDVDREIYRVALGGAGTEPALLARGGLHEYGAWWLVAELEREQPGFVRRLLTLAAARGDDDPNGLRLVARALGGRRALEAASRASPEWRSTTRSSGLRCARAARRACGPAGSSSCARACRRSSLRLWRVPDRGDRA